MTTRRLTLTAGLLGCALAVSGPAFADPTVSADGYPQHSSDGVRGPIAPAVPTYARTVERRSAVTGWRVAPGVRYQTWAERDARGRIRAHLLRIKYRTPGLRLNYATPGRVARTETVRGMLARQAVAGINGDFFDISDSGAPFGIGAGRASGLLHGPSDAWSAGFTVTKAGAPSVGPIQVRARIRQHPAWTVSGFNSPTVADGTIGVYSSRWGTTPGYGVTDGVKSRIVQVRVKNGKVVSKRVRLRAGHRIDGFLLIGRGAGAQALRQLKIGDPISVAKGVTEHPGVAITSNSFLVQDGAITVTDDAQMHPRSAIGIDRDTHQILMLVVDGRSKYSRGYTMVELADEMVRLGADSALNLDGGGSSTLVARKPGGAKPVVNKPSDGRPRKVANGIQVLYSKP
ncbi:phosphodiester glycosidase family protein [Nocardioides lianchengensis]|uniref:Phosphodiester glycosidase domain-containing protein n=1 Tax=Nocardioides lianchengensis TaxID=1045774 RepID=A0A1G6ZHP1_9ACTN|nr:phosphodiester glycosidase family protein [Nocardioides lianchengensis]NYG11383.1 hypothetical protein [Nocardioides lianchengensis]SDE01777.1 Predicted protein [Nocardioides lianchengensis]